MAEIPIKLLIRTVGVIGQEETIKEEIVTKEKWFIGSLDELLSDDYKEYLYELKERKWYIHDYYAGAAFIWAYRKDTLDNTILKLVRKTNDNIFTERGTTTLKTTLKIRNNLSKIDGTSEKRDELHAGKYKHKQITDTDGGGPYSLYMKIKGGKLVAWALADIDDIDDIIN